MPTPLKKQTKERRNGFMTGMRGVYLAASELTKVGLIVSPTSRSSFGADILVTDERCQKAWSVQVKTNSGRPKFWLVSKHSRTLASPSHIYVFINLCQHNPKQIKDHPFPEFYVVPSRVVASLLTRKAPDAAFYDINTRDISKYKDRWSTFRRATA